MSGAQVREAVEERWGACAVLPLAAKDGIPAEHGTLMGVTQNGNHPHISLLWFQREDQSLTVVYVDHQKGLLRDDVLTIPRR